MIGNTEYQKRILLFMCVLAITAIMVVMLRQKQQDKETLYALFKIEQNLNIEENGRFYRQLRDIQCSLTSSGQPKNEELEMYLEVYANSINHFLQQSFVDSEVKQRLRESLQYVPCACRNS